MSNRTRQLVFVAVGGLALAAIASGADGPDPAADARPQQVVTQICDRFGSARVQGGRYVVQNNEWGDSVGQCISVTETGFTVTAGNHNKPTNGAPGAYPSIFRGCHYNNCSTASGLPAQVSSLGTLASSARVTVPSSGAWNASYDLWLDPTPRIDGQNTGAEIMVWVNHLGPPQPVGSRVGTATLAGATWDVWFGDSGWNVISYVRQQTTTSFDGTLRSFVDDAISRGHAQRAWYLTSVQFGFEPWVGGPGLAVDSFSVETGGGSGTTTTSSPTTTSSSTSTTRPAGGGPCRVAYSADTWPGGFVANLTITNTSGAPVNGWTLRFTFPGDAVVTNMWNAAPTQSGRTVDARNLSYNATIAPNGTASFGFQAGFQSNGNAPTTFTLNGTTCSVA
jgi:Glycosyl hydrolase family 12/Cellulose binding domain